VNILKLKSSLKETTSNRPLDGVPCRRPTIHQWRHVVLTLCWLHCWREMLSQATHWVRDAGHQLRTHASRC